ncbi:MAG: TA system VapC family ribonuclease toxin [Dehalococcoidia bacterium]
MVVLLDANVLIALVSIEHVHHDSAEAWLRDLDDEFATCPSTEGSLLRFLIREGHGVATVHNVLSEIASDPRHEFWPDALSYTDVPLNEVMGHRQVTDAYLTALARSHRTRIATFDRGLAAAYPDVVDLIPTA